MIAKAHHVRPSISVNGARRHEARGLEGQDAREGRGLVHESRPARVANEVFNWWPTSQARRPSPSCVATSLINKRSAEPGKRRREDGSPIGPEPGEARVRFTPAVLLGASPQRYTLAQRRS